MAHHSTPGARPRLPAVAFARLGVGGVAYTRPVRTLEGEDAWGVFGADGTHLGIAPDREAAVMAIIEHEMAPVALH